MKQNQKKRFNNGRFNNRNQQKQITRNTVFDSSGPCGKLRGTALQLVEKYQAGAKDALMQNDIVLAQTCMQFADHYIRLQNQAIQNEQRGNQNNQPRAKEVEMQDDLPEIQMPESKDDLNEGEKVETALDGVVEKARDEKKPAFAEPKVEEKAESKEKSESKAGGEEKSSKTPNKPKPQIVKVKRRVKEVDQEEQMAASSLQEKPQEQVKEGEE